MDSKNIGFLIGLLVASSLAAYGGVQLERRGLAPGSPAKNRRTYEVTTFGERFGDIRLYSRHHSLNAAQRKAEELFATGAYRAVHVDEADGGDNMMILSDRSSYA